MFTENYPEKLLSLYKLDLSKKGYVIVDDVLPLELAERLYDAYEQETNWEMIDQVRKNHYTHVFKSDNLFLPQEGEIYSAQFSRSNVLEKTNLIKDTFHKYFVLLLNELSPFELSEYDVRSYKQSSGDHYRTQMDDYAGQINLIYYVNKTWRWDWGGILNILSHDDLSFCQAVFPKFNRVVLLNNKVFRAPHYVSSVEKFALNPRYSIVAFSKGK